MITLIEFLVSKIKKRKFSFDHEITSEQIFVLILAKAIRLFRGVFFFRRLMFVGKATQILSLKKLMINSKNIEIGDYCIVNCLSREGISLGENFKLGDFSRIIASGSLRDIGLGISIGNNVAIAEYSFIGGAGGVSIGDDCIIGQYFSVHPENHNFEELSSTILSQGLSRKGIKIGSNCWVGAKVTICDGASIGSGCIIAAGAVVTKTFPDNCVIGGVPSKILRMRSNDK